jgi:hypothetical protein
MTASNQFMLALLRSRAHRLADQRYCELEYWAPRAGRVVHLPVAYAWDHERIIVFAGRAAHKRWWRAFRHSRELFVRLNGDLLRGRGVVVPAAHPTASVIRTAYERATGGRAGGDGVFVVIHLESALAGASIH